jgi:hypothetical protein
MCLIPVNMVINKDTLDTGTSLQREVKKVNQKPHEFSALE